MNRFEIVKKTLRLDKFIDDYVKLEAKRLNISQNTFIKLCIISYSIKSSEREGLVNAKDEDIFTDIKNLLARRRSLSDLIKFFDKKSDI